MAIKVTSILRLDNIVNSSCSFHGYCYPRLDNRRVRELTLNTYSKIVRRYVRWQKFIFINCGLLCTKFTVYLVCNVLCLSSGAESCY